MHVYLVRHAQPKNIADTDPDLSREGVAQAKMLGRLFASLQLQPDVVRILSSRMRRTRTTATYICQGMGLADDVVIFPTPQEEQSGSDLKDLLMQRLRRIAAEEARSEVIVIGHYPTLSKAFAWLAGQKAWPLPQDYGAAACLHCQDSFGEASGALKWLVTAELLLGIQRYPRRSRVITIGSMSIPQGENV